MRDKSEKIRQENDEYKRRMELFERELEEL